MAWRSSRKIKGMIGGAALAVVASIVTLLLPPEFGGYNTWTDPHLALHNISAILVRLVVFALIGAAVGGAWHWPRRTHR
jgi:hypothetical protein